MKDTKLRDFLEVYAFVIFQSTVAAIGGTVIIVLISTPGCRSQIPPESIKNLTTKQIIEANEYHVGGFALQKICDNCSYHKKGGRGSYYDCRYWGNPKNTDVCPTCGNDSFSAKPVKKLTYNGRSWQWEGHIELDGTVVLYGGGIFDNCYSALPIILKPSTNNDKAQKICEILKGNGEEYDEETIAMIKKVLEEPSK